MKHYFILHGSFGSNIENWFPWLKEKIDNKERLCTIPQFPINELQTYDNWKQLLDYYKNLGMINKDTVVFAHSIGCIFIIKYLLEQKIKVEKLILVSGFNNYYLLEEFDKVNQSFFIEEKEENNIKEYVNKIITIYSENDPYISLEELARFTKAIGGESVIIKDGGHFNKTAGYTEFEQLLKYV